MNPEEQIWKTATAQGKSNDFIKNAILTYRQSKQTVAPVVTPPTPAPQGVMSKIVDAGKSVFNAFTSSEQGLGKDIATAITAPGQIADATRASADQNNYIQTLLSEKIKAQSKGMDTTHYDTLLNKAQPAIFQMPDIPTTGQVLGHAAGTALDIASAGSYGVAARGAETGALLTSAARKAATPVATTVAQKTLGTTLKNIGTKTAIRSAVGAGTGYGYDVAGNLQNGKTGTDALQPGMGTLVGGIAPVLIGGVQAGVAISKDTAPRFINSLIKPSQANFSYGKDPGRTVSEMGITGNNLQDFSHNISTAKRDIGTQIGAVYDNPANAGLKINATTEITKLDSAIQEAAKGGKSNQSIVTALQNAKDALLYAHGVDANGNIVKIGNTARDLSNLSPKEAFQLKDLVSGQTKFTGNPSDDKVVNNILKNIYGGLKEKLNSVVGTNNPEITKLNQQYADLTSALLATQHRDAIVSRANIISMPIKVGGATALVTSLSTGGAAIPAILAGATVAALDSALQSTAVKTRIAAWLGSESPSTITKVLQKNPGIKTVLYRALPKFASQLGQP